jgi:hypothetical protein
MILNLWVGVAVMLPMIERMNRQARLAAPQH